MEDVTDKRVCPWHPGKVIEEMLSLNDKLGSLNNEAGSLEKVIRKNIAQIAGEE